MRAAVGPDVELLIEMHGFTPEQLRRHATVLRQFSLHFVGKHGFDADAGRMLRRAGDVRIVADYDEADVKKIASALSREVDALKTRMSTTGGKEIVDFKL